MINYKNGQTEVYTQNLIKIDVVGIFTFLCGFTIWYSINIIGQIYITEILLIPVAFATVLMGRAKQLIRTRKYWVLIILFWILIAAYILSDIIAGTEPTRYLKAWGRNAVLLSDIVVISIVAVHDKKNLMWYFLGMAIGEFLYLQFTGIPFNNWKFGYGNSIIILSICTSYILPNLLKVGLFVLIGLLALYFDSRAQGAFSFTIAGVLWFKSGLSNKINLNLKAVSKFLTIGIVLLSILAYTLVVTDDKYAIRREASNIGRFAAYKIALNAIVESPIIGYGSWGEGTEEFANMHHKDTSRAFSRMGINTHRGKHLMAHSQILQSWMEGGVFAALFFFVLGYHIIIACLKVALKRKLDFLTPLFIYVLISALWHLFMSPYSGIHRLGIAAAISVVCILALENTTYDSYD